MIGWGGALVATLLLLAAVPMAEAVTLPPGFEDQPVTSSVPNATALAFTPDGRMLILDRTGKVRIYKNGALNATAALDITPSVCSNSERGLLGVAVDPAFTPTADNFIYVYYTFKKFGVCDTSGSNTPVNRVSRFTLAADDTISTASEVVMIDNIHSPAGNHNAGDVQFGKDGYLYVSVGDGGCDYAGGGCGAGNDASRDQFVLLGKVLRITRDGGIPPDNPFQGVGTDRCNVTGMTLAVNKCRETYAWGLRNPFRLAFDSNAAGTRFFINDVGEGKWEEVDLGTSAADYGWNVREGPCAVDSYTDCGPPPAGMTNPIHSYPHTTGCGSITGGAFVPVGIWPSEYSGSYLYQDFNCGRMFKLTQSGSTFVVSDFGSGDFNTFSLVSMTFGPNGSSQALYYTTLNGPGSQVRKIVYTGSPYPVPAGATPLRVPLVPAFQACTSPNGNHGGGLPGPSCSNPQQVSSTATLGNSTDQLARIGFARAIMCDSTASPGCAQVVTAPDVRLLGNGSDVVCRTGAPPAACPGGAGSDYDPNPALGPYLAGLDSGTNPNTTPPTPICNPSPPNPSTCSGGADMTAVAEIPGSTSPTGKAIRITDRLNDTPSAFDPPTCAGSISCSGTVLDQAFPVPVVCEGTVSTGIGSYCGVNTTADALVPGVAVGGKGAVVEIGQVQVLDAGPDGVRANSDDQLFAVQGVFVP